MAQTSALRRSTCVLFTVITVGGLFIGMPAAQQAPEPYVTGELLVQFKPGASEDRRAAVRAAHGARTVRRYDRLDTEQLILPATANVRAVAQALRVHPDVAAAQPNFIRQITATAPPNDPYWLNGSLWGLEKISASAAWNNFGAGTDTVVVADIDTGVDYTHPDLAANMWTNPGEIAGNGVDDDGNGYVDDVYGIDTRNHDGDPADDHGHGTHTAGTFGAVSNNGLGVAGVSLNVRILACKFISSGGTGTDAGAIECFNYVVNQRQRGVNVRVTNNSWGGLRESVFPSVLKNAIDTAGENGILNVFAAGNDGIDTDVYPFDPASFTSPSIVSVAASDSGDGRATWSNYGVNSVDLAAPGASILSTVIGGYGWASGTSMATPHVAGAAALLLSHSPGLGVLAVKDALLNNVDRLDQWNGLVASAGRLNAYRTLTGTSVNVSPSVSLTSPTPGTTVTAPATISLAAAANDSDGSVTRVDFYANGGWIGADATAPYEVTWSSVGAGTYSLTAIAMDNGGATTTSDAVTIQVLTPSNVPPTITLSSPSDGASFAAPATIVMTAAANDSDGGIARVDFYVGGVLAGSTATSPYSLTLNNLGAGTYSLSAIAVDVDGASTASGVVTVYVTNASNQPPQVALTSPVDGSVFSPSTAIQLTATAADADSGVARVEFYAGATLIGVSTAAPYTITWTNVPFGNYSLTARAYDADGASSISAPVRIRVKRK